MEFIKIILPVCCASLCNTLANGFWKSELSRKPLNLSSISKVIQTILSFNIIIGILFYIGSMLIFLYLLSNYKLSVVIPLTSLTYVFNILLAYFIFHETISIHQIIGTLVIITGIVIISQAPLSIKP